MSYKDLLEMCQRKLMANEPIDDILKKNSKFLDTLDEEEREVFEREIEQTIKSYHLNREKRKNYWMLLCNTRLWKEDEELYRVNELLQHFKPQRWKINSQTMDKKVKKGDWGIIKVGEDGRTNSERYDNKGELVSSLEAGIYAIFEVIGEETYFVGDECFIDIKFRENYNLFSRGKIISKKESIRLLDKRKNIYSSKSSIKIDKDIFEDIMNYIEDNKDSNL